MKKYNIEYKRLTNILLVMLMALNFLMVAFISSVTSITLMKIVSTAQAALFLEQTGHIPSFSPHTLFIASNFFYLLLVVLITIGMKKNSNRNISRMISLLGITCCCCIMYYLQFSNNAVLLLFIAYIIYTNKENTDRFSFLFIAIIIYLISNYNILAIFHPISFEVYVSWYSSKTQFFMNLVESFLDTMNMILFILVMFVMVVDEFNENKRVKALNEELQHLNHQLQEYASLQEKMGETKERNRLAREIHDTLGHTLTGLSVGIDAAMMIMDVDQEATKKQLSVLSETARQGLRDVRRSVEKLRPDALERFSLQEALEKMIIDFTLVSNVDIKFIFHLENFVFQKDTEEVIYRVVQEGLTNAIRHGHAKHIFVSFAFEEEKSMLIIIIEDDGVGCLHIEEGFGLHHMRERLEILNGRLRVYGYDGFVVIAEIPLRREENKIV